MTSTAQKFFNAGARYIQKPTLSALAHQPTLNKVFEATSALTTRPLRGCEQRFTFLDRFRIRRMLPAQGGDNLLLYFHGGGFTIGSSFTHRWLAARLAAQIGAQAWLPDYRLAPRHPFPAAPEDCFAAYEHALWSYTADRIVLGGDSAGGTLVLNTITRIAKAGLPQPAAIGLLSPLADLTGSSPSRETFRHSDMLLPAKWVERCIPAYLNGQPPDDPTVSPLFADLSMTPPCALHVAEGEMLYDDAERLAGVLPDLGYHCWDNVPHVWQLAAGWTTEADTSLSVMAHYLKLHLP